MTKQVFKIIGIVLGSVLALTGGVLGVMAAMGKFSTPDVYPAYLYFEDSEITVGYDANDPDKIYSFVLSATPSDEYSEYEVNQKTCYIFFENDGDTLITICDANGNPITAVKNRYEVNCNENIYFRVNAVEDDYFDESEYGKVVVKAVDSRSLVQSSNSITINVDRMVSEIDLDANLSYTVTTETENNVNHTVVTLSITQSQDFAYAVTPSHSLKPISGVDAKSVELYYIANDYSETDYVRITESNYSNYDFIKYDQTTGVFSFLSSTSGTYSFVVAVFASYQARTDYLASIEGVANVTNVTRVGNMVHKYIDFNVVNTDVEDVAFGIANAVQLNLYTDNNYITLNGTSGISGANNNNLALTMKQSGAYTTSRFNEIDFALSNDTASWSANGISFSSDEGVSVLLTSSTSITLAGFANLGIEDVDGIWDSYKVEGSSITIYNGGTAVISLSYTLGNVAIGDKYIIENLTYTYAGDQTLTLTSSNGAVFVDKSDATTLKLTRLSSGSYIDFFVQDRSTANYAYTLATAEQFSFSASFVGGTLGSRTWNVVAKTTPSLSSDQSLIFGILVVNANGNYYFEWVYAGVNAVDLSYTQDATIYDLTVEYDSKNSVYTYPEIAFSDIVSITAGSYTACVFVTPKSDTGNYDIEVLENIVFIDGNSNEYVLVGYLDENGLFVNSVKVASGATNVGTKLYMLQLKNAYGETAVGYLNRINSEQTASGNTFFASTDEISTYLAGNANNIVGVVTMYTTDIDITIYVNYEFATTGIDFDFSACDGNENYLLENNDASISVVENVNDYKVVLSSTISGMLTNIFNTGECTFSVLLYTQNSEGGSSTALTLRTTEAYLNDSGMIELMFNAGSALSSSEAYLKIKMTYNGVSVYSPAIYILSTTATDITYNYTPTGGAETTIDLDENITTAKVNTTFYVSVNITYDTNEDKYLYEYTLNLGGEKTITFSSLDELFNTASPYAGAGNDDYSNFGFYVSIDQISGYPKTLTYSSENSDIISVSTGEGGYSFTICSIGTAVIKITSDGIERYVKVIVEAKDFELSASSGSQTTAITTELSDLVTYEYDGEDLEINSTTVSVTDVEVISFGANLATVVENVDNTWTISTTTGTAILTISDTGEGSTWVITRNNYLYVSLSVEITLKTLTNDAITASISFTNTTTIERNADWSTFYAGTTIRATEERTDTADEFSTGALFKITNKSGGSSVTVSVRYDSGSYVTISDNTYTFGDAGTYIFKFELGGTELLTYEIEVVDNIIMVATASTEDLSSDTDYTTTELQNLFTLYSYATGTDVVYGSEELGIYPESKRSELDAYSDITITATDLTETITITYSNSTLTIGHMEDLTGQITGLLVVKYGDLELGSISISITNLYMDSYSFTHKEAYFDEDTKTITIMGYTEYESFVTMSGDTYSLSGIVVSVNGVELSGFEFDFGTNTFTITTYPEADGVVSAYNNVVLKFIFSNGSNKLFISTTAETFDNYTINIVPYTPTLADTATEAYSEHTFDLLTDVFDINDISDYISSIIITVDDATQNSYFVADTYTDETGYNGTNNNCPVKFAAIEGDSVTISVNYAITYVSGGVYNYTYELTINNYQELTITYPLSGLTSSTTFAINEDSDSITDGEYMGGTPYGTNYTISFNYEPVQIGEEITLDFDSVFSTTRINITDRTLTEEEAKTATNDFSYTISLIGYESTPNVINYVKNGNITISDHTITFGEDSTNFGAGNHGYVVFKITTNSGQIGYYYVYLYNASNYSGVSYNSAVAYSYDDGEADYLVTDSSTSLLGVDVTTLASALNMTATASNLKFYLLDADLKGDTDFLSLVELEYGLNDEISEEKLPTIYNYLTLKIGVLYSTGNINIFLGTAIFYVAPADISVEESGTGTVTDLAQVIEGAATGEYTATILSSTTSVGNPFTVAQAADSSKTLSITDPTLTILSVDSDDYTIDADGNTIISISGTAITISKYVTTDLTFTVQYAFQLSGDTTEIFVLTVTYTLEGITTDANTAYNIGSFTTENGFDNNLSLSEIVGSDYNKNVEIKFSDDYSYSINVKDHTITNKGNINYVSLNSDTTKLLYLAETSYSLILSGASTQSTITLTYQDGEYLITLDSDTYESDTYEAAFVDNNNITIFTIGGVTTSDYSSFITISSSGLLTIYGTNSAIVGQVNLKAVFYDGAGHLVFSLTNVKYTLDATITLSDIDKTTSKPVQFNILAGYQPIQIMGSEGYSSSTALTATCDSTINYNSKTGSTITFKYDDTKGYYSYSLGGLTIYTSSPMSLTATGATDGYIVGTDVSGSDYVVSFAHSTSDVTMALYVTVYDASGVSTYNSTAIQFYVTIPQTYKGLKLTYSISGADHENVYSASSPELYEYFFEASDIYSAEISVTNQKRVAIKDLNGNLTYIYDYEAMGFNDTSNPNYVEFTGSRGVSISNTTNTGETTLTSTAIFGTVTSATTAYVYLELGGSTLKFDFQILGGTSGDLLIDYQVDADTHSATTEATQYVTILVDTSSGKSDLVTDRNIANLVDGNNTMFYITSVAISSTSATPIVSGTKTTEYPYIYEITAKYFNYVMTLKLSNTKGIYVSLTYIGTDTPTLESLTYTLTLYGDGGAIIKDFKIIFMNYSFTTSYSVTVASSSTVDIGSSISITSAGSSVSSSTALLTLQTDESYYYLSGTSTKNTISDNNDRTYTSDLFTYNSSSRILTTDATAQPVTIYLVFTVSINGYSVGTISYTIILTRNFDFYVNGKILTSDADQTTSYQFDYNNDNLTYTAGTTGTFTITDNLTTSDGESDSAKYASDLLLQIKSGSSEKDLSIITITEYSSSDNYVSWTESGYLTISSTSLKFTGDYTGTLKLILSVTAGGGAGGTYSVDWIIDVTGFVTLSYGSLGENDIQTNSGAGYTSGTTVTPIANSGSSASTANVFMSNVLYSQSQYSQSQASITAVNANVSYVILSNNSVAIDAATLFASETAVTLNDLSVALTSGVSGTSVNTLSLTLPTVPQSSANNGGYTTYLVIFKISLDYLGQETKNYYVSYWVYNPNNITANTSSSGLINVDTGLTGTYLELFYFAETYEFTYDTTEKGTVTIYYNGTKECKCATVKGYSSSLNGSYTYSTEDGRYENDENDYYYFTIDSNNKIIFNDDDEQTYTCSCSYVTSEEASVFNVAFSDIDEFVDFITQLAELDNSAIKFSSMTGYAGSETAGSETVIYFKLEYIADGRFGINLANKYSDVACSNLINSPTELFNNTLTAYITIVISNQDICTIEAYSTSYNGFGLTTSSVIKAKSDGGTQYTVADIFPSRDVSDQSVLDYTILGVATYTTDTSTLGYTTDISTTISNWINPTITLVSSDHIATITVPGTSSYVYYLYEVTVKASNSSSNPLYNLTATFYVIVAPSVTNGTIIVVNYGSSLQEERFDINFTSGTDAEFDLTNKFYVYSMDASGILTQSSIDTSSISVTENTTTYSTIDTTGNGTITVTEETLRSYKNSNTDEDGTVTYLDITYTMTYSGVALTFTIRYYLPAEKTAYLDTTATATSDNLSKTSPSISLESIISYPYYITTSSSVVKGTVITTLSKIEEVGTSYTSAISEGMIEFNMTAIETYFADNSDDLIVNFTGEFSDGTGAFEFTITIKYDGTDYTYTISQVKYVYLDSTAFNASGVLTTARVYLDGIISYINSDETVTDISKLTTLEEVDTSYTSKILISSGMIIFNMTAIETYFADNSDDLVVNFAGTYNSGEFKFTITIKYNVTYYTYTISQTEYVKLSSTATNASGTLSEEGISLKDILSYTNSDGTVTDISKLTTLEEVDTSYTSKIEISSGTIVFDTDAIGAYFTSNSNDLVVNFKGEFNGGAFEFTITIKSDYSYTITQTDYVNFDSDADNISGTLTTGQIYLEGVVSYIDIDGTVTDLSSLTTLVEVVDTSSYTTGIEISSGTIKFNMSAVKTYFANNSDNLVVYFTGTYNGGEFKFTITIKSDYSYTISQIDCVYFDSTATNVSGALTTSGISLDGIISYTDTDGNVTKYAELTTLEEVDTSYTSEIEISSGTIVFDMTAIGTYFTSNSNDLVVNFKGEFNGGAFEFTITIKYDGTDYSYTITQTY